MDDPAKSAESTLREVGFSGSPDGRARLVSPDDQIAAGVSPDYIRISVGIEDVNDITDDLDQALKASQ